MTLVMSKVHISAEQLRDGACLSVAWNSSQLCLSLNAFQTETKSASFGAMTNIISCYCGALVMLVPQYRCHNSLTYFIKPHRRPTISHITTAEQQKQKKMLSTNIT